MAFRRDGTPRNLEALGKKIALRLDSWAQLIQIVPRNPERNPIMTPLESKLTELGVTIDCGNRTHMRTGWTNCRAVDDRKWPHFAWNAELEFKGRRLPVEFKMGIAHCKPLSEARRRSAFRRITGSNEWMFCEAVPPSVADVVANMAGSMTSLLEPFEVWACDFGYDTDSREAEKTYHACQKEAQSLIGLFGRDLAFALSELEH